MELFTLAATGAKYILKLIAGSKTVTTAKDDAVGKSWEWVKQHVFKRNPSIEENLKNAGSEDEKESELRRELMILLRQEEFRQEFEELIKSLQPKFSMKNVWEGSIKEIGGSFSIGDKGSGDKTLKDEDHLIKNVAKGDIGIIHGDFNIGDSK